MAEALQAGAFPNSAGQVEETTGSRHTSGPVPSTVRHHADEGAGGTCPKTGRPAVLVEPATNRLARSGQRGALVQEEAASRRPDLARGLPRGSVCQQARQMRVAELLVLVATAGKAQGSAWSGSVLQQQAAAQATER